MGFIKKNLLKVIECSDFEANTLVKKFEYSDRYEIMKGSKLTVRPSQVAIFIHKGQVCDIFKEGQYSLDTSNLPILSKIASIVYGFEMPNLTDIYFVNMVQFTNLKWGTSNPIMLRDSDFGVIRLMGHGEYAFRIKDPKTFMVEYFGTLKSTTSERIHEYLKSIVLSELTDVIGESKIPALELAAYYREIGDLVRDHLQDKFGKLGLEATEVIIKNLKLPEAVEQAIDKRSTLGVISDKMNEYAQVESLAAMRDAAKNQGTGGMFAGMGVGLAAGQQIGGIFAANTQRQTQPAQQQDQSVKCSCGATLDSNAKFCANCGKKVVAQTSSVCAKCGMSMPLNAKFCPNCGASAKLLCPKCGHEVPQGTKFCPECGSKL